MVVIEMTQKEQNALRRFFTFGYTSRPIAIKETMRQCVRSGPYSCPLIYWKAIYRNGAERYYYQGFQRHESAAIRSELI